MAFVARTFGLTVGLLSLFVRLLPLWVAISFFYSRRGPFLDPLCNHLSLRCSNESLVIGGLLSEAEVYGPVLRQYLRNFAVNEDLGGSLAVFAEGEPVLDVYAGFKDLRHTIPYDNRTLNQVYSSGKVLEGILIARLVDKGLLDYEEKISTYWPEFAQNGKGHLRLKDLMMHQAGVHYLDDEEDLSWALMQDRSRWSARLASQKYHFPGHGDDSSESSLPPQRAYHAVTRGWFLDEIVRRVDPQGRGLDQLAKEELMQSYPDIELYYGALPQTTDWEDRLTPMYDYPAFRLLGRLLLPRTLQTHHYLGTPGLAPLHRLTSRIVQPKSHTFKALFPRMARRPSAFRTKDAHEVASTSFSLKTNAHSLARLLSMMANKGQSYNSSEPHLLSQATYEMATHHVTEYEDLVTLDKHRISHGGWIRSRDFFPGLEGVLVQGWGGAGGSLTVWMEELQMGFCYVTNAMGAPDYTLGDGRAKKLLLLAVQARKKQLGLLPKEEEVVADKVLDQ
ncbi:hypothetical protein BGZ73_003442 [Actinomortierella ambigua]|nr:hypothetical protein BGZ73_003442 [Actinomortierella ambigua]